MSETQAEERPLVQRFDGKVATFKVTNIFFSMGICEGDFFVVACLTPDIERM